MKKQTPRSLQGLYLLPTGIGCLLALEMMRIWDDLPYYYGADCLLDPAIAAAWHSGIGWSVGELLDLAPLLQLHLLAGLYVFACVLLCWPFTVRIGAVALLLLHQAFFLSDSSWSYGVDYVAQTGLWLTLLFYPSPRYFRRFSAWHQVGVILLQAQLALVYFFGGLGKLLGESWHSGEALWKAIQQPFANALLPIPAYSIHWPYLWMVAGLGVVLLEITYPLAWIGKRYRLCILGGTVAMHIGIALYIGLYHFAALMIWYNLCAWYFPYLQTTNYSPSLASDPRHVTSTMSTDLAQYKERRKEHT